MNHEDHDATSPTSPSTLSPLVDQVASVKEPKPPHARRRKEPIYVAKDISMFYFTLIVILLAIIIYQGKFL